MARTKNSYFNQIACMAAMINTQNNYELDQRSVAIGIQYGIGLAFFNTENASKLHDTLKSHNTEEIEKPMFSSLWDISEQFAILES